MRCVCECVWCIMYHCNESTIFAFYFSCIFFCFFFAIFFHYVLSLFVTVPFSIFTFLSILSRFIQMSAWWLGSLCEWFIFSICIYLFWHFFRFINSSPIPLFHFPAFISFILSFFLYEYMNGYLYRNIHWHFSCNDIKLLIKFAFAHSLR